MTFSLAHALVNTGFLISATIDKYIYITVYEPFKDYILLKYSTNEKVTKIKNIKHPIIRKVLDKFYKNKKVLVTGATGFKGAWLCSWLLKLGAKVSGTGYNPNENKNLINLFKGFLV